MMAAEEAAKKKKNLANCFRKVKEAYVKVRKFLRRKDMHYGDDKMLFNDWSFAKKVKQFKPQPDRRALRHLEHYDVGAEVESFEHMPTWYPAVVVKYNANGSYVLRFDNGEVADAVDPAHIRFRVAPPISGLQQFVCASLLVVFAVWPAWIALYLAERGFRASGPGVLVVPLLLFALLMMVAIRAAQESEIPNFKGSYLGRFPLVLTDFWTSDRLSERSRSVDAFSGTRARGTLTLKRR